MWGLRGGWPGLLGIGHVSIRSPEGLRLFASVARSCPFASAVLFVLSACLFVDFARSIVVFKKLV